ncbi:MAG: hydratase [Syntrophus sp. (in: bacteria)]|nr:hydratase [Syntrophus sp. (in: bacteria)]
MFVLALGLNSINAADTGAQLAEQFLKKTPLTSFDAAMTLSGASKVQEEFISVISKEFGEPVGYKAGLTNPNVQKVFGVSQPVRGALLKKMILKSGADIPADFGAISVSEGDLIVRVGDEAINQAKTPEETLKWLDAVIPFIELPDMVFDKTMKPTAPAIVAINVGARYGVMGEPIALGATEEWRDRLKNFTLQLFDEKGTVIAEGKGTALLGDPLNVVLWLKESLAGEGKRLKKGDLLSLGSITRPMPAKPGTVLRAKYTGLDPRGPVEISVNFK